jgi:hypothetical protein
VCGAAQGMYAGAVHGGAPIPWGSTMGPAFSHTHPLYEASFSALVKQSKMAPQMWYECCWRLGLIKRHHTAMD